MKHSERTAPDWPFRVVADTNVFISSVSPKALERSNANGFQRPAAVEFVERGLFEEFSLFFSLGTWLELAEQLEQHVGSEDVRVDFLEQLHAVCEGVEPSSSERFCVDADDDKFVHVAIGGSASHLVSEDRHILILNRSTHSFDFKIVKTVGFLRTLRGRLKELRKAEQ